MPKYSVEVSFPIKGYEYHDLEVVASNAEEAEKKAIEFVQTGEGEGVTQSQKCWLDDTQAYNEGNSSRPVEYSVQVDEIKEKETKDV
jgi:hypothetical protein